MYCRGNLRFLITLNLNIILVCKLDVLQHIIEFAPKWVINHLHHLILSLRFDSPVKLSWFRNYVIFFELYKDLTMTISIYRRHHTFLLMNYMKYACYDWISHSRFEIYRIYLHKSFIQGLFYFTFNWKGFLWIF